MPPSLPINWPQGVPFFSMPQHSKRLTREQQHALKTKQAGEPDIPTTQTQIPSPLVRITPITTRTHPAFGQYGLCATRQLPPGTLILLYLGLVHGNDESEIQKQQGTISLSDGEGQPPADPQEPESDYDLWLDRGSELAVDAAKGGNEARFINDYRGIGDRPNAEFREVWSQRFQQRCMAVFVLPPSKGSKGKSQKGGGKGKKSGSSGAGIAKGEEVLVSYGKGFWQHRVYVEAGETTGSGTANS